LFVLFTRGKTGCFTSLLLDSSSYALVMSELFDANTFIRAPERDDLNSASAPMKRARVSSGRAAVDILDPTIRLDTLLAEVVDTHESECFESLLDPLLEEYLRAREEELRKVRQKDEEVCLAAVVLPTKVLICS
jgi:hypothetical protein